MKYRIMITPPKSKRMIGSGKVIIGIEDSWNVRAEVSFDVCGESHFDFEMPDEIQWICRKTVMDGKYFDIKLIYTNKNGTISETLCLAPEELIS